MEENAQLKIQVDKCKDAIKILTTEYNKLSSTTPNLLSPKAPATSGFSLIDILFNHHFFNYCEKWPPFQRNGC